VGIGSNVAMQASQAMTMTGPDGMGNVSGYQQRLNHMIVNPGASIRFETLVPKASPAQLQVTFKNLTTNQIYSYQVAK
jgi:hypothetical protein